MISKRLFQVQIVLLAGFGSIFLLPHSSKTSPAGIAMTLPRTVGEWIGDDAQVTQKERDALAKDTQFARKLYYNLGGDQIFVSIVLSGDDMTNSIHRPERCLPAQGWSLQSSQKRALQMGDGKALPVTKLRTFQTFESRGQRTVVHNVTYYWFIGASEMTPSHLVRTGIDLRDRILHGENQRWAYLTVAANMAPGFGRPEQSETHVSETIEQFIQQLVPQLHKPDGSPLF